MPEKIQEPRCSLDEAVEWTEKLAKKFHPGFIVDENNSEAIRAVVAWFGRYPEFEQMHPELNYSLEKGLCLQGTVGSGKTLLMEIMQTSQNHTNQRFIISNCSEISDNYAEKGVLTLKPYGRDSFRTESNGYGTAVMRNKPIHRCFDELGMEDTRSNNFGNYRNVMADIICARYDMWRKYGMITHLTTNTDGDKIEAIYGDRIRSRLREMCNFIRLIGRDRRK